MAHHAQYNKFIICTDIPLHTIYNISTGVCQALNIMTHHLSVCMVHIGTVITIEN